MGLASVALKLAGKGLKPAINKTEKSLTYFTKGGVQKTLIFDSADKVKFWQSIDSLSGKMKVYNKVSDTLSERVSQVELFENFGHNPATKIITTKKDKSTGKVLLQKVQEGNIIRTVFRASSKESENAVPLLRYKKAKTIQEAKEYARNYLGIKTFNVSDLEIANQINYSLTKAYNKTGGKMSHLFDEVDYSYAHSMDMNGYSSKYKMVDCAAQAHASFKNNKLEKCILRINKGFFENIDSSLNQMLSSYKEAGQLCKDKSGRDIIKLCTPYRYADTLNRYYRLYQQGKLSPKAKFDFKSLLHAAREEENFLLYHGDAITACARKELGIDLSKYHGDDYLKEAKKAVLQIEAKNGYMLGFKEDIFKTRGAVGLDGTILHEAGHAKHYQVAPYSVLKNNRKLDKDDYKIALEISEYAAENDKETVAEYVAGILSNDKYTKPVKDLVNRILNRKTA